MALSIPIYFLLLLHYGSHTELLNFKMFCVGLYNGELRDSQHQKAFGDSIPHKICVHVFLKKSLAPLFKFSQQPACLPAGRQLG